MKLGDFEWDNSKAEANFAKHGVSFEEGITAFTAPQAEVADDPKHSTTEPRFVLIGETTSGRVVVVVLTPRDDKTRIIGARPASRKERRLYNDSKR